MADFYIYILKCSDSSYYVGHTDNIEQRISEHKNGVHGCYTSTRLPVEVAFVQPFASRYEALSAEHKIKRWSRKKKEALMQGDWESVKKLSKKTFE